NKRWLYEKRLSKYFSWAAVITKGSEKSLDYCCSAIYLHPKSLNDITTAIIEDAYPDKTYFIDRLIRTAFSSTFFSPIVLTYVLIKQNKHDQLKTLINKSYVESIFPDDELLESFSLTSQYKLVVDLFESSQDPSLVTLPIYEMVYDALTKLNRLSEAKAIFNRADTLFNEERKCSNKTINPHAINNKLERHFWFQKGDLIKAYATYKRQRLAQVLANVFTDKYTQDISVVESSKSPLILASWGPGDEIRYSKTYQILQKINPNITVSCEPRLHSILLNRYPGIKFLPVTRTRRVDSASAHMFNKLPDKKLHHILDNKTYSKIKQYSHICLLTDILSELIEKSMPEAHMPTKNIGIVPTDNLKVGISWTSSINTASRSEHYFSVDDLSQLFKMPSVDFYSLQYGNCSSELAEIKKKYGVDIIESDIDQFNDFEAVLKLMDRLDVILSVGTTVLELSGLSKTPVFVLTNSRA
ncbi:hypothetical protein, partial [Salinivibrio sp. IB643]|uniref:hypothetical protein n=1 Tax=Salinivibrio sp. IB643 TaxID=1909445 RepID=UPI0009C42FF0